MLAMFNMSSANAFNLDKSKNLLFGKGLSVPQSDTKVVASSNDSRQNISQNTKYCGRNI